METIRFTKNEAAARTIAAYYDTPPMLYVHSFGCQQNVNDGEKIKGVLTDIGFGLAARPEDADLIVFNTCAVREHAEQRVFGNVGALKGLKEANPKLLIAVSGCMAQQKEIVEKFKKHYPFVDIVFGVNGIDTLPDILCEKLATRKRVLRMPAERGEIIEDMPIRRDSTFRAWLPIMYGCDNFCSYCIVPYVRGRERSRASADILREFRQLVAEGYKDITLLGQNVNSYGKGLPEDITFAALLRMLDAVPGDYRIRFMTSHPKDATRELIDTIANSAHISRHLHLPVQSGSNSILAQMNRKYTVEDYLSLIAYAKRRMPEMTYSSDIIVGFPGETEEDFCATEALIREVEYMQLFTFIYSKRTGTAAASMPDPTPHKEKTQRIARVLAIQEQVVAKLGGAMVGKTVRAGFKAIAAAGGGVVLFLLLALPVIAVAAALSPAGILADSHTMEPTGEAMEVWERLPDDLSMERRMVVTYALALVDKVDYFWGGKSLVLGWDDRWGELTEVTAEGSDSTGTEQPYGLDCSGFVDWAFYNASGGEYVIGQGGGAMEQHANCVDIEWDEVQPGDLLFYPEDEHVGIAAGRDWLGRLLVVHCASGTGGVAISHRTGFETAARPVWYTDE